MLSQLPRLQAECELPKKHNEGSSWLTFGNERPQKKKSK
jgi:hypothetical protein